MRFIQYGRAAAPLLVAIFTALLLLVLSGGPVSAAAIQVTTSADENGTGAGCSLREAVIAANTDAAFGGCPAGSGTDQITFAAGTNGNTILLENSEIQITSNLQIVGNGATQTRVDGQKGTGFATRVFNIDAGNTVTLDALTVQNGSSGALGGGILNGGTLTVTNALITGNVAANGGGIASTFGGTLDVSNSTLDGNTTTSVGGGGILAQGTATVTTSTVSNNMAPVNGGGINVQSAGTVTVTNSTISGNTSVSLGGGLSNLGTTNIVSSTIANNNGNGGDGIASGNTNVSFHASIMANANNGENCNPNGATFTTLGSNVADDATCFVKAGTDQVVADVMLGALANNGGPTQTHALINGSAAIDAVQGICPVSTDQRGLPRPGGVRCDAGAFERQVGTLQLSSATCIVNEGAGTAEITVTRSGGSESTVGVTLTLTDGTASAPADYTGTPFVLSFADGETSKTVQVPIVNDALPEGAETVNLALTSPTGGATLGTPNTAVLTITDNDTTGLAIDDVTVTEGGAGGTTTANFTVTLRPASAQTVTVTATTANGTATAGSDYTTKTQTLTFAPGETSRTFPVTVIGDDDVEPDETFLVDLSGASNADIGDGRGLGTIKNDDSEPNINPNNSGSGDQKDRDEKPKDTEDTRRHAQHTNQSGHDDHHTEGNVVSWEMAPDGRNLLVTIALGGGQTQVVFIPCPDGKCPRPQAGDYLEADGDLHGVGDADSWFWATESWTFTPKR